MYSPEQTNLNRMLDQVWKDYHNGNKEALNNIYKHLMPFCLRVCSNTCGRYITDHDEEASIARLAIIETLKNMTLPKVQAWFFSDRLSEPALLIISVKRKNIVCCPLHFLLVKKPVLLEKLMIVFLRRF